MSNFLIYGFVSQIQWPDSSSDDEGDNVLKAGFESEAETYAKIDTPLTTPLPDEEEQEEVQEDEELVHSPLSSGLSDVRFDVNAGELIRYLLLPYESEEQNQPYSDLICEQQPNLNLKLNLDQEANLDQQSTSDPQPIAQIQLGSHQQRSRLLSQSDPNQENHRGIPRVLPEIDLVSAQFRRFPFPVQVSTNNYTWMSPSPDRVVGSHFHWYNLSREDLDRLDGLFRLRRG